MSNKNFQRHLPRFLIIREAFRFLSLFLFLFILNLASAFAQRTSIDSMIQVLESENLSIQDRVKTLNDLGTAITYFNADSSINYFLEAIELAEENDLDSLLKDSFRLLSRAYYVKGEYYYAYNQVEKALEMAEELDDSLRKAKSLNTLGTISFMLNDPEKAIQQHRASIQIFKSLKDTVNLCNNYLNLAIVYQSKGQLDSALFYIEETIDQTQAIGNTSFLPISYGRYGEILFQMGEYEKAGEAFEKGLQHQEITNWDKGFNLTGLSNVNYKLGNYSEAIVLAKKGIENSLRVSSFWDLQRAYEVMAKSQEELGNYKEANTYNKLYKLYSDSLYNSEKDKEFQYLLFKEEELKNELLHKENENTVSQLKLKSIQIWMLAIGMFILILFSLFLWSSRKAKQKLLVKLKGRNERISIQKKKIRNQIEELKKLNESKDKIFSVIGHDLKSPIASLQGLIDLTIEGELSEQELKEWIKLLSLKVKSIQEMLNNLLYWAKNNLNDFTHQPRQIILSALIDQKIEIWESIAKEKEIEIIHHKKEDISVYFDPDHLRIILRNLIANAIKFTNRGGEITIYYKQRMNQVLLFIKDNGVGIPQEKLDKLFLVYGNDISGYGTQNESGTGIGLSLVSGFLKSNGGSIEVESELGKGTTFKLIIPAVKEE